MRNPDGTLDGNLNDNLSAITSGSIVRYAPSTLNENDTVYDLLPVFINRPPVIIASISEASSPHVKPYATADATGKSMYLFPDGTVKVNLGVDMILRLRAEQPNILNVENGVPKIIPPNTDLKFVWKKDGSLITSYNLDSLNSQLIVSGSTITIKNMQPSHAGTYNCEIQNDIGTTVSEPIVLEVFNLDFDDYFYKNLVKNPYGLDGSSEWSSTSTDLIAKKLSSTPSTEYTKTNRVDLFGYTPDMMHPRPYQIDPGVIRGFDMTKDLVKNKGSYFTRTRYTYVKRGGSFLVRAYQDVDVTEIQQLIKGGVYGVEGVRALFSCYIGNALTSFVPTANLVNPNTRTNSRNYVTSKPRISQENFLNSGPSLGPQEMVYVTLEEFDNESRLPSNLLMSDGSTEIRNERLSLMDPWNKRTGKHWSKIYYDTDVYGLGSLSKGDARDMTLFTADELYPDSESRYTYGQYIEFNKLVLERLNPNTTKVRIGLNFETKDWRLFEPVTTLYPDDVLEFIGWQAPYTKNSWNVDPTLKSILMSLRDTAGVTPYAEFLPAGNDPRGLITALNLTLLPILTHAKETTDYYTNTALVQNNTPQSTVPTGLSLDRGYDPFDKLGRRLKLTFKYQAGSSGSINNNGIIDVKDELQISVSLYNPNTAVSWDRFLIQQDSLLPFKKQATMLVEGTGLITSSVEKILRYAEYRYIPIHTSGSINTTKTIGDFTAKTKFANDLIDAQWSLDWNYALGQTTASTNYTRQPDKVNDKLSHWNNKARYELSFALPGSSNPIGSFTDVRVTDFATGTNYALTMQSYYLDVDFSNPRDTKVSLSRPGNLLPGRGAITSYLSHSIDPNGQLNCQLSDDILFGLIASGGMNYTKIKPTDKLTIKDHPIQCATGLYNTLGINSLVPLKNNTTYQDIVGEIFVPIEADLQLFQAGSSVSSSIPFTRAFISQFSQSLSNYIQGYSSSIDSNLYNGINNYYSSSFDIVLVNWSSTQTRIPDSLKNLRSPIGAFPYYATAPSLLGVKPVAPEVFNDGVASPTFGTDEIGYNYTIVYGPIQDSVAGTYTG
jgi:hypothetical protein